MRIAGRHLLQIPGHANVPDRILGPWPGRQSITAVRNLPRLGAASWKELPRFPVRGPVVIYPASGTGAWEAALVNTLSPNDQVLMYETGHFAMLWRKLAQRLGLDAELFQGDWRSGADPAAIEARLREDADHRIKAVCIVHNETSTG